jgi:AcrR family transcriptional regulator
MLSEAPLEHGAVEPGALYPKLRPGPPESAQESVASNQRARLYGAMIEMLATRGYEASTVVESCALAGVSKRTLYERFPGGKPECFLTTYDIIVRPRLLGGRSAELALLAGELRRGASRDRNRSLQSNEVRG